MMVHWQPMNGQGAVALAGRFTRPAQAEDIDGMPRLHEGMDLTPDSRVIRHIKLANYANSRHRINLMNVWMSRFFAQRVLTEGPVSGHPLGTVFRPQASRGVRAPPCLRSWPP